MNSRGRVRSQAQRAGTSYAYLHQTDDLVEINNPTPMMQAQQFMYGKNPDQAWFVPIEQPYSPPGPLKYPPKSDVNLLLQSEDWVRAGLFYRASDAYNWRMEPIPYIEKQLSPWDV